MLPSDSSILWNGSRLASPRFIAVSLLVSLNDADLSGDELPQCYRKKWVNIPPVVLGKNIWLVDS